MNIIYKWLKQASSFTPVFTTRDGKFIIYKGFKLSETSEGFSIQDVRFSNMYSDVSQKDMATIIKLGFVKGVDTISFERDTKRVDSYKKRTEVLYDKKNKFAKELPKNRALNEKRIRNIEIKIEEFIDLMFFYQVRIKQFNIKNNKNE
jgi:predicted carbohydrate-binding protein with CBM5 and CBM33 domain